MSDLTVAETDGGMGHRLLRMTGRSPSEPHRTATPLELLFDLTFVVAFGLASSQFSHYVAEGHILPALVGFTFAMFAVCWAWINFSWFASAYDTDDWYFRLTTMVQMIGVIVLALGLPSVFSSLDEGKPVDNDVMVAGYVVMRVAMIAQWSRAARQDPKRRTTALSYVKYISIAQAGWIVLAILDLPAIATFCLATLLFAVEFAGPVLAERKNGGTPWNAHHIAERYGLLAIIALGESIFGTIAAVSALVEEQGWSIEAVLIVIAGVGLTFGLWWSYFIIPSGAVLAKRRARSHVWGYSHILVYASIAATGAGLHVAAYVIEGHAAIGAVGAVLAVAIPILVFSVALFGIYTFLMHEADPFHLGLFVGTILVLVLGVALAALGVDLGVCLLVLMVAPAVTVVGYETIGHRHAREALARATS
ncbi:low temperature requirement protein A [soil metagenome]